MFLADLAILVLAGFVGFSVISKVPNTLHTPLMSGTNAIHGIVVLGGLLLLAESGDLGTGTTVILFVALVFGAINATAPPPTPLNSATICGIAVIRTCRAAGTPTTVPIAAPTMISPQLPMSGISSVATTAIAIPTAAIRLPRTAVRGPVSPINP